MAFVRTHLACDDCGSSDARSLDDKGWSICFSCDKRFKLKESDMEAQLDVPSKKISSGNFDRTKEDLNTKPYKSVVARGISSDTCKTYKAQMNGERMTFGYHDKDGFLVELRLGHLRRSSLHQVLGQTQYYLDRTYSLRVVSSLLSPRGSMMH